MEFNSSRTPVPASKIDAVPHCGVICLLSGPQLLSRLSHCLLVNHLHILGVAHLAECVGGHFISGPTTGVRGVQGKNWLNSDSGEFRPKKFS